MDSLLRQTIDYFLGQGWSFPSTTNCTKSQTLAIPNGHRVKICSGEEAAFIMLLCAFPKDLEAIGKSLHENGWDRNLDALNKALRQQNSEDSTTSTYNDIITNSIRFIFITWKLQKQLTVNASKDRDLCECLSNLQVRRGELMWDIFKVPSKRPAFAALVLAIIGAASLAAMTFTGFSPVMLSFGILALLAAITLGAIWIHDQRNFSEVSNTMHKHLRRLAEAVTKAEKKPDSRKEDSEDTQSRLFDGEPQGNTVVMALGC